MLEKIENHIHILIPARGGSKRIPNKNIINLCEKPLIHYAIEESLKITKNVFVSTESEKIKAICKKYKVSIIDRPEELATDTSSTNSVVYHFLKNRDVKYFAVVQPTAPLLTAAFLKKGFEMISDVKYNSIISVCEKKEFYWNDAGEPMNFCIGKKPRTQDVKAWYAENGAFYITSKEDFLKEHALVRGRVGFVEMPKMDSIDIDGYEDLEIARAFMKFRINASGPKYERVEK